MTWNKLRCTRLTFVLMFVAALGLRFSTLGASRMIAERQFRSALMARAYFFESTDSVPEWRTQIAEISKERMDILEPPIMELIVASAYRIIEKEQLWIAQLLSSLCWAIGGIFLYRIAGRMASEEAAMLGTAYYLFVPLGVVVSISFLPEPLMVMMFLLSLLTIVRYYEQPSTTRVAIAGIASGLAILIKPFTLFAILGAFLSLKRCNETSWKEVVDLDLSIFLGIYSLPLVFYYLYGVFVADYLADNAQGSLLPQLLLTRDYWQRWLLTAASAVGIAPLVASLLGISMLRQAWSRALVIGLGVGYAIFCLVFTYHIRFADYYHLQLVIIVALALVPVIASLTDHLRQPSSRWYRWLPAVGALLLVLLFDLRGVRARLGSSRGFESKEIAQEIGEMVNHSGHTVYIAPYYGAPLEYYGELSGTYWPRRATDRDRALGVPHERSVEERLDALDFTPEYFVITDLDEYHTHHTDLREFLADCPLVSESDQYLVYEACTE